MNKLLAMGVALMLCGTSAQAQRKTDPLDRGLVAVPTQSTGNFISWRIMPEEYYDVTYNLYRNGSLIAKGLSVSNYTDTGGSTTSSYTVRPVVRGMEGSACAAAKPWTTIDTNKNRYLGIKMADVYDRNGTCVWKNANGTITSTQNYEVNDVSLGDVDGDGKIDFIVKRINSTDRNDLFPVSNTTAFCRIEVYGSTKNYGLLWYIDCGPNTIYGPDEQWDAVAFDWDQDGRCEVLYRAYANTVIHKADGTTVTIGSAKENIRANITSAANYTYSNTGNEYLVYMNGLTGEPYVTMEYPLKRLEPAELFTVINWDNPTAAQVTSYKAAVKKAWGDDYGHRSSKYFMGAPYLDGRKPSIFLGRGIYTREKMITYDVDPATHQLTHRWTWTNNAPGTPWYGQGYHNFSIGDVDEDGCDEIIYGSMVIDNNGKGLSTTGLGHGDASHTGDLDPFRKGLETFACNEDKPGNNFRNATTCQIYYRNTAGDDDGRSMACNVSNLYPGCQGASTSSGIIALGADKPSAIEGWLNDWNTNTPNPMALNIRIYWDGDLLEETMNGPGGSEGEMFVGKNGGRIFMTGGAKSCNGTKKNTSATGDIIGDWREEIVMRSADDAEIRIYTTTFPTSYRIPSLWFDHVYRQGMVWESEGYNQPPHTSYFLGELEGITQAPPALTNSGRTELTANATIGTQHNNACVMLCNPGSYGISSTGASPAQVIVNASSVVSGNTGKGTDANGITTTTYNTIELGGNGNAGDLTGNMRLVKQGDGILRMPERIFSYKGATDVWTGTLVMPGTLNDSPVWLNRHTSLYTSGSIKRPLTMEYGSMLRIDKDVTNGTPEICTANIDTLNMHEGARLVLDFNAETGECDQINMKSLSIRKQNWSYGPKYLTPVMEIRSKGNIPAGDYVIGTAASIKGDLSDIVLESDIIHPKYMKLYSMDENIILQIQSNDADFVGKPNNSTPFWGDFSNYYDLANGQTTHFSFTTYGDGMENYHSWYLVVANRGQGHSTEDRSDYAEHFVLRADNYGWGTSYSTPTIACTNGTFSWASFRDDMEQGADVEMDVTYNGGVVTVNAATTAKSGRIYTYKFTSKAISDGGKGITLFFTIENSHMTKPVASMKNAAVISMTHVNYDEPDKAYGPLTKAESGFNKISGGTVAFSNPVWKVNYITYLKVDASAYKSGQFSNIRNVILSFEGSGSADSKRATSWGIGYNKSEWSSTMTYNTADKSITTIGETKNSTSTSATKFETYSWDITDVLEADDDGILTIIVYEGIAGGGYVQNVKVTADAEFNGIQREPLDDEEPTNVIARTTNVLDFKNYSSAECTIELSAASTGTAWETGNQRYQNIYDVASPSQLSGVLAMQGYTNVYTGKGFILRSGYGLGMVNANRSGALQNLKAGTVVDFYIADRNAYPIDFRGGGKGDGEWTVEETSYGYSIKMTADGNLGFCMAKGGYNYPTSYITKIEITSPVILTLEPKMDDKYDAGIYETVILNRSLNAGFSSLCVPFNATVTEFTNGDANAYVAYLSEATESNGKYALRFSKTQEIKANQPYIIYLSRELKTPTFRNKPVLAEKAQTITAGNWSMTGNYEVGKDMYGLYGVAKNATLMGGDTGSFLNGFTAFISSTTGAQALSVTLTGLTEDEEDDATFVTTYYGLPDNMSVQAIHSPDGRRMARMQPGLNIVTLTNGKVKKVYVYGK